MKMVEIKQLQTNEEKDFYDLIQTAKTMDELHPLLKWFNNDKKMKETQRGYKSPVCDEAKILMLRKLMYNDSFSDLLYNLGREKEYKDMDYLLNHLIKNNNSLDCRMYKSAQGRESVSLRPRVFDGDTITHIAGRLGYFNILNKIFLFPAGIETLKMSNASGYLPVDAIGVQMNWVSADKELKAEEKKLQHDRLKGCEKTSINHIQIATWMHVTGQTEYTQKKKMWPKKVLELFSSVVTNGLAVTAAGEAYSLCYNKLLNNQEKRWIGVDPDPKQAPEASVKSSLVKRIAKHLEMMPPALYGAPSPMVVEQLLYSRQRS